MKTYLFYDLETTGLNKVFDQVLQFAAIRTDMTFKEIERYNIMIKLRPDVIPSPAAMITHRISLKQSMQGICEYEAIVQIHRILNQANTISLGYNTATFDDEFLRFCFHRNMLPPYEHQYKNGCSRMDLLPITNIYYLYKREVLIWPEIDKKPTMKLEHLSTANKLATGQAHNAMVDVEATLELARRFSSKEPNIWHYLEGYFNKATDKKRIEKIPISFESVACCNRIGLMIGNKYGSDNQYQVPVLLIGSSIPYKNQNIWLRLDLPELRKGIPEETWVIRKKYGEPGIVLPADPQHWDSLSPERQAIVAENKEWLQSHTHLFHQIIQYHREFRYPKIPNLDIDAALYQNDFLSSQEQTQCQQFHQASLADKIKLVGTLFEDIQMRQLASRLLCRNYPQNLPRMLTCYFKEYMQYIKPKHEEEALKDYKNQKRTTPLDAQTEIDKLLNEYDLDEQQFELLDELAHYISRL